MNTEIQNPTRVIQTANELSNMTVVEIDTENGTWVYSTAVHQGEVFSVRAAFRGDAASELARFPKAAGVKGTQYLSVLYDLRSNRVTGARNEAAERRLSKFLAILQG